MTPNEGQQLLVAVARLEEGQKRQEENQGRLEEKVETTILLQRETNGNVTRLREWRIVIEERLRRIMESDAKWSDRRFVIASATISGSLVTAIGVVLTRTF